MKRPWLAKECLVERDGSSILRITQLFGVNRASLQNWNRANGMEDENKHCGLSKSIC